MQTLGMRLGMSYRKRLIKDNEAVLGWQNERNELLDKINSLKGEIDIITNNLNVGDWDWAQSQSPIPTI